ncbi:hypothetical protein PMAYCL1PPCAC_32762 [Pristionchus mayeri]|uniref:Uncharacterized protein n=1 Tax=Pristionchus mayeri TaxID=1317129 RepID=A0AAN5DHE2_9BILA|nr:hypothetical protein PMAYCL1PPCAC_32762 [Pristionchus mayeri]
MRLALLFLGSLSFAAAMRCLVGTGDEESDVFSPIDCFDFSPFCYTTYFKGTPTVSKGCGFGVCQDPYWNGDAYCCTGDLCNARDRSGNLITTTSGNQQSTSAASETNFLLTTSVAAAALLHL